jgi:hypothetical protein
VTGGVLGLAFVLSLFNLLPGGLAGSRHDGYPVFWPQGWSFFANVPAGGAVVAYRLGEDGSLGPRLTEPMSAAGDLHGLSRSGYARIVELGKVTEAVPRDLWRTCDPATCATGSEHLVSVRNPLTSPVLCGRVALVLEPDGPGHAHRVATVDVDCG